MSKKVAGRNFKSISRLKALASVIETFNRSDSASLGKTSTGASWSNVRGSWGISSNKASSAGAASGYPLATLNFSKEDVTLTAKGVAPGTGTAFWVTDSDNWWGTYVDTVQTCDTCSSGGNCSTYATIVTANSNCTGYGTQVAANANCTGYGTSYSGGNCSGYGVVGYSGGNCAGYGVVAYSGGNCSGYSTGYSGGGCTAYQTNTSTNCVVTAYANSSGNCAEYYSSTSNGNCSFYISGGCAYYNPTNRYYAGKGGYAGGNCVPAGSYCVAYNPSSTNYGCSYYNPPSQYSYCVVYASTYSQPCVAFAPTNSYQFCSSSNPTNANYGCTSSNPTNANYGCTSANPTVASTFCATANPTYYSSFCATANPTVYGTQCTANNPVVYSSCNCVNNDKVKIVKSVAGTVSTVATLAFTSTIAAIKTVLSGNSVTVSAYSDTSATTQIGSSQETTISGQTKSKVHGILKGVVTYGTANSTVDQFEVE